MRGARGKGNYEDGKEQEAGRRRTEGPSVAQASWGQDLRVYDAMVDQDRMEIWEKTRG